jgi:hypothetical protein
MASAKPPKPPVFDAKAANDAWKELKKPDGTPYAVFQNDSFIQQVAWGRKVGYDVQKANAEYLDEVKGDLDSFRQSQGVKNSAQDAEIAALKEAVANLPFP